MHPGWIRNQCTPGSEHFTGNPGSPTKTKTVYPRAHLRLADPACQLGTQGLRWSRHLIPLSSRGKHLSERPWEPDGDTWLHSVPSRKLESCRSSSWKWIPAWSQWWRKQQWRYQLENKMRKEICKGTCWESPFQTRLTQLWASTALRGNTNHSKVVISFLGCLIPITL